MGKTDDIDDRDTHATRVSQEIREEKPALEGFPLAGLSLDFPEGEIDIRPMKKLFFLLAMLLCFSQVQAAYLRLNGELSWNVTDPQCGFKLNGTITNYGLLGTGNLRLALWATEFPYPSSGTLVGQFPLGSLPPDYKFTDFRVKGPATLPIQNGELYFTITVMEYTTAGWRNVLMVPTGTQTLFQGEFVNQKKWLLPIKPLVEPPSKLLVGEQLILTEKASSELNLFPLGWRQRSVLDVEKNKNIGYSTKERDATVSYSYKVLKRKYLHRRGNAGQLVVTRRDSDRNLTFKQTITLFFQGKYRGTYKSVVSGSLGGESYDVQSTWGTFRYR